MRLLLTAQLTPFTKCHTSLYCIYEEKKDNKTELNLMCEFNLLDTALIRQAQQVPHAVCYILRRNVIDGWME